MKNPITLFSLLLLVFSSHLSFAQETQTIALKDGSQIRGTLSGVSNGVYTISTPTMGNVKINASQVSSISSGALSAPSSGTGSGLSTSDINQKIQTAQARMMSDPAMMQQVTEMMQDPQVMQLLSDPELSRLVMSRDIKAIEANPKAKQLMANPKIRALMEQLRGSIQ